MWAFLKRHWQELRKSGLGRTNHAGSRDWFWLDQTGKSLALTELDSIHQTASYFSGCLSQTLFGQYLGGKWF